jgi:hypothetical protein
MKNIILLALMSTALSSSASATPNFSPEQKQAMIAFQQCYASRPDPSNFKDIDQACTWEESKVNEQLGKDSGAFYGVMARSSDRGANFVEPWLRETPQADVTSYGSGISQTPAPAPTPATADIQKSASAEGAHQVTAPFDYAKWPRNDDFFRVNEGYINKHHPAYAQGGQVDFGMHKSYIEKYFREMYSARKVLVTPKYRVTESGDVDICGWVQATNANGGPVTQQFFWRNPGKDSKTLPVMSVRGSDMRASTQCSIELLVDDAD